MNTPEFLETDVVFFLHDQALREYGGLHGLKSEDLLLSALSRAPDKFAYADHETPDLFDLSAAYAFGPVSNDAFNDGNKQTAWGCCMLFLKLNGITIGVPAREVVEHMVQLAAGLLTEAAFATWLRSKAP